MRIVSYLLTFALLGIAATGVSFAGEAGRGARSAGNVSTSPAEPSASRSSPVENAGEGAAKLDGRPQAHSKADETRAPAGEGAEKGIGGVTSGPGASGLGDKGDDVIDTRIGMPSRRLDGGRNQVENVKARVRLLAPRQPSTPGTFDQGVRNAIGVPLAPRGGQERRDGEHHGVASVVPNSSAPGVAAGTNAEGRLKRATVLRAATSPGLYPGTLNRATINGTGMTRPGLGQQSIGGPAKTFAGIGGTAIRSKH